VSRKIRVLIVDDHSLFREGLARLLAAEPEFEIAGNCAHLDEALKVLEGDQTDMVLLDHDLETEQGWRLLENMKQRAKKPKVLMVTAGMSRADMLNVMDQGAAGIFLKHSPPAQLAEAIRRVIAGEMWLDPKAVKPLIRSATRRADEDRLESSLSDREKAVLKGVLEGASNKKIGASLHLSEGTVKAALQQLFGKTGVRTRSQLVRLALERHAHDWLADETQ
jgi:DNA-binding NarL/FixJ family response regulator